MTRLGKQSKQQGSSLPTQKMHYYQRNPSNLPIHFHISIVWSPQMGHLMTPFCIKSCCCDCWLQCLSCVCVCVFSWNIHGRILLGNIPTNDPLVGGFNPFEKYAHKIWSFPQGWTYKKLKPPSPLDNHNWTFATVDGQKIWRFTSWYGKYPHYLQGFSTIPGGWEGDFWTHSIHVWYIYLHLPQKSTKCR